VLVDRSDAFLEDHVLGRGGTNHLAEPSEVGRAPSGSPRAPDVLLEQEGFEPKLGRLEITEGIFTGTREVADGFGFHGGAIDGPSASAEPVAPRHGGRCSRGRPPFQESRRRRPNSDGLFSGDSERANSHSGQLRRSR
jgi:hypothetical protein